MCTFLRGPPVLTPLLILAVAGCTGDSVMPTSLEPEAEPQASAEAPESSLAVVPAGAEVPVSISLTPSDLLADPFLESMVQCLENPTRVEGLSTAMEALKASLLAADRTATEASLQEALSAVRDYARVPGTTDEDVLHLDAIELTLDELERITESVQSEKNKG